MLDKGEVRRPLRGLYVVRRSQSLTVALASEAVRRRWERGAGRKERAVMETSPRREGVSDLEGASEEEVGMGAKGKSGRGAWAAGMVLVEQAYLGLVWVEVRDGDSPSRETWSFWTGTSRLLQRRSHICTLPSLLQVASTLEEPG